MWSVRSVSEVNRKRTKIEVDREEYEALCALRDGAHEQLKIDLMAARENYDRVCAVNRDQVARLNLQDLQILNLQKLAEEKHAELMKWKPATFEVKQPGKKVAT